MAFRSQFLKTVLFAVGLAFVGQSSAALAGDGFMLATGRQTGKSFAVGVGISSLAKVKLLPLHKMDLSPVESRGFVDNVRLLQQNEAQFAILQAMFGHFARTGTGTFAGETPNDDIRAIAMLWRDAEHFVIDEDYVKTGTIADIGQLQGMPVSMGVDGPGPIESNRLLLSHFNVDVDQSFSLAHLNYQQSSKALQQGEIVAMSTPIRPPAPHIQEALNNNDNRYKLLEFTDDQIVRADGGLGLWTPYVIPAATYPGQTQDIQTVAKSNLLVARKDVDPEVVYQVTKAVFENLDFLRNIHDAMYETSVDRALVGVPMPLHPGALRYFQEIGLLGPDANLEVALASSVRQAESTAFRPNGSLKTLDQTGGNEAELQRASLTQPLDGTQPLIGDTTDEKTFVVYFDLGEKEVSGDGLQELAEISAYADNLTNANITITGHTDLSGDPVFNQYLAEVRAKSVVNALTATYGMAGHTIEIVNRGSEEPAINDGRTYQPRNRRVEITVVPANPTEPQVDAIDPENDAAHTWGKRASI
ncbi:MAG: TAXI family TRAP transporter solute-binding subunit [Geminicoccaceae bacterium]